MRLCPAPATRRDQGEQFVSSASSCPGDLNPKQRGRQFSSIIPGRSWQCGEEGSSVTPCGPMPQRWPWPWGSVWQCSCCIPLLPGVQDPGHGGCPSQAFWAQMVGVGLAGDLSDSPDLTGHVMLFAEPPGCCRMQVPSQDRSCCRGNTFPQPQICLASSLLLVKPTPGSQAASSLHFC